MSPCGRDRGVVSLPPLLWALIPAGHSTLIVLSKPSCLPKAPCPYTIPLGVRASTSELGVQGHIHSAHTTAPLVKQEINLIKNLK